MRRYQALAGLLVTVLAGLILASAAPANATHPVSRSRIADVDGRTFATASTTNASVTMQPPMTYLAPQYWNFSDVGFGTRVTNFATNQCLGLPDYWYGLYPPVVQQPCSIISRQSWRIEPTTTSTVMFRNVARDGCIAIDASGTGPARLYLVPCNTDDRNQHFRLVF